MSDPVKTWPGIAHIVDSAAGVAACLWDKGWAERNGGNLSVDLTNLINADDEHTPYTYAFEQEYSCLAGRVFLVTGTGKRFRDFAKDVPANACILQIGEDGKKYRLLHGGDGSQSFRPTSEFPAHLRIHEYLHVNGRPETVVLHTHPTELVALTHLPRYQKEKPLNDALWRIHPEVKVTLPKGMGLAPYTLPGSEKLAQATVAAFRNGHDVAMWQMHGCVAIAEEVDVAFDLIDTLNKGAQLLLHCLSTGAKPVGLTDDQLDELVKAFKLEE